ncbi:hypothetical protein D3C77_723220 [compost metagenome]
MTFLRSKPWSEYFAKMVFTITPLNDTVAIKKPNALVLIPKTVVQYNDKYGLVKEIPTPIESILIMYIL